MLGHKTSLNKFGSSKISNLSFKFKKLEKEKINPKSIEKNNGDQNRNQWNRKEKNRKKKLVYLQKY